MYNNKLILQGIKLFIVCLAVFIFMLLPNFYIYNSFHGKINNTTKISESVLNKIMVNDGRIKKVEDVLTAYIYNINKLDNEISRIKENVSLEFKNFFSKAQPKDKSKSMDEILMAVSQPVLSEIL